MGTDLVSLMSDGFTPHVQVPKSWSSAVRLHAMPTIPDPHDDSSKRKMLSLYIKVLLKLIQLVHKMKEDFNVGRTAGYRWHTDN